MESLGGRKTSELLLNMWELCPADQHSNIFFAVLFLQHLPRDIRVLLTQSPQLLMTLRTTGGCLTGQEQEPPAAVQYQTAEEASSAGTSAAKQGKVPYCSDDAG